MVVSLPYGSGRLFWARAHAGSVTIINSELAAVSAAISAVSTWKRPATPVDLCGHATLASAHTLIEQDSVDVLSPIRFQARSDEWRCTQPRSRIKLDFPSTPAKNDVDASTATTPRAAFGIV